MKVAFQWEFTVDDKPEKWRAVRRQSELQHFADELYFERASKDALGKERWLHTVTLQSVRDVNYDRQSHNDQWKQALAMLLLQIDDGVVRRKRVKK